MSDRTDAESFRFSEDVKNGSDHSYELSEPIEEQCPHGYVFGDCVKCLPHEHDLVGNDYGHFICTKADRPAPSGGAPDALRAERQPQCVEKDEIVGFFEDMVFKPAQQPETQREVDVVRRWLQLNFGYDLPELVNSLAQDIASRDRKLRDRRDAAWLKHLGYEMVDVLESTPIESEEDFADVVANAPKIGEVRRQALEDARAIVSEAFGHRENVCCQILAALAPQERSEGQQQYQDLSAKQTDKAGEPRASEETK